MLDNKIGCLPVMRDDKLVGIITESGIFRTFMELFAAREKGLRITLACPNKAGELANTILLCFSDSYCQKDKGAGKEERLLFDDLFHER